MMEITGRDFTKALQMTERMKRVVEEKPTDFSPAYWHHLKVEIEALKVAIMEEVKTNAQLRELEKEATARGSP